MVRSVDNRNLVEITSHVLNRNLIYAKNIKPGLTDDNKVKRVLFVQRVHRKWGLPPTVTKILWIHSDEKVTPALNITLTITPSLTFALPLTSPLPLSPP